MTKTPGTMTLKKFLPKICTLRGLEARIADFGLKGPGFDPPTNQKNFFYTPFLTILHTVFIEITIVGMVVINYFFRFAKVGN